MDINNMTIGELKEIKQFLQMPVHELARDSHPYQINKNYFIRTVTMSLYGKLIAVHDQELVLQDAAWIADTGRFMDALQTGDFDEIEPFPDGELIVGRGAIIDAVVLQHQEKREQV